MTKNFIALTKKNLNKTVEDLMKLVTERLG